MTKRQRKSLIRIVVSLGLFILIEIAINILPFNECLGQQGALYAEFFLFIVPYLVSGYDVLVKAGRGILHGRFLDENFLMAVATIGSFALVAFPDAQPYFAEGAAVMLFYQIGMWFQSYAVGKNRESIASMMDIVPEFATVQQADGSLETVDPADVSLGDTIIVRPGERVPLDGEVINGCSQLDTAALTGESVPRVVEPGASVASGCINLTGVLTVHVQKPYEESTVQRILELVENASDKKSRTENFITRFARYYTPVVVSAAVILAVIPPLFAGLSWSDWIQRALVFLVVSCPCALVISVPLSFFGGIGGASRRGILVKGSNYLEVLAKTDTVVFDKTGTLTSGVFSVVAVKPEPCMSNEELLCLAAHAEQFSTHPLAKSVVRAYGKPLENGWVSEAQEESGHGVRALVEGRLVAVGSYKLMEQLGVAVTPHSTATSYSVAEKFQPAMGTVLHVAVDGEYAGCVVVADVTKPDAKHAIELLHTGGVSRIIMLTGDRTEVASAVADELGIREYFAQLLPEGKVAKVAELLALQESNRALAFVGDGINDAPALMRADVGIAMGALGTDAAIEAADIVLMDDKPSNIALAIRIARRTMTIVWQNIIFAIGVKVAILFLAAVGFASMWLAVFGDVGVAMLAILNAMRTLRVKQ